MKRRPTIAVVLAAGESRRFAGELKQLLPFAGESLVYRACRTALDSRAAAVILVVGHRGDEVRAAVEDLPVTVVGNRKHAYGQSTSVRLGLQTVRHQHPEAAGVLFLPCDQPLIDAPLLDRLIATAEEHGGKAIIVPTHHHRRGAPVFFPRRFFPELEAITGDEGGRQVIRRYPDALVLVELEDEGPLLDADTVEGYAALVERAGG